MSSIFEKLEDYLLESLGQTVQVKPWEKIEALPLYLAKMFQYTLINLCGKDCLLLFVYQEKTLGPAKIAKHCMSVQVETGLPCILVQENITNYQRKAFVSLGIPFIVPEKYIYLPNLGIDFKESRTSKVKGPANSTLSPATRLAILYLLVHGLIKEVSPSQLADQLGYSRMTMTRTFDELHKAKIGTLTQKGKYRLWEFEGSRRSLWKQVKDLLPSPVKQSLWIGSPLEFEQVASGESALDHYSMLAGPSIPIYATGRKEWKQRLQKQAQVLPYSDEAIFQLEILEYDPKILSSEGYVDPFSLYLSLRESQDERVQMAIEEMMEAIQW